MNATKVTLFFYPPHKLHFLTKLTNKVFALLRSVGVLALASVAPEVRPILRKLRRTSSESRRAKLGTAKKQK